MTESASPAVPESIAKTPPGVLATLRNGVVFLVAMAVVCASIGATLPMPAVEGIYPKYRYFAEHRDAIDVLFLGSSRFYHQIIPRQFDAAVAAATGKKWRSFNAAYDGVWLPESGYLLRQYLALKPGNLKWVVIDCMDVNANLDERNKKSRRAAYWHDLRHTCMAWTAINRMKVAAARKWELRIEHAGLLFSEWINRGRGAEWFGDVLIESQKGRERRWRRQAAPDKAWDGREGFGPGPDTPMVGEELRGYEQTVARLKEGIPPAPVADDFREAVEQMVADVRAAGAQPVLVIAPTLNGNENFTGLPGDVPLIKFNDPNEYPELYDPGVHYDGWHLNERGAKLFTDALVRRFLQESGLDRQ